MTKLNKLLLVLTLFAVVTVITTASRRAPNQQNVTSKEQKATGLDETQWPIADYEAPEPTDEKKRSKRIAKGNRYNKSLFGVKGAIKAPPETAQIITLTEHSDEGLSAFPAAESDVVVIGEVLGASAYVSTDKTSVYSEFDLLIGEALKIDNVLPIESGGSITLERVGGRVRAPSGRIQLYRIAEQNMPQSGRRYVLFLQRKKPDQDFNIITGYELREGQVFPLDGSTKFDAYKGMNETLFLQAVRNAISQN